MLRRSSILPSGCLIKKRIKENFDVFDFELSELDIEELDGLDCGFRTCPDKEYEEHYWYPHRENYDEVSYM